MYPSIDVLLRKHKGHLYYYQIDHRCVNRELRLFRARAFLRLPPIGQDMFAHQGPAAFAQEIPARYCKKCADCAFSGAGYEKGAHTVQVWTPIGFRAMLSKLYGERYPLKYRYAARIATRTPTEAITSHLFQEARDDLRSSSVSVP